MNTHSFNSRTQRARISAGWSHATEHYSFMREHKSRAPFVEPRSAHVVAEAVIGAVALFILGLIVIFFGAY